MDHLRRLQVLLCTLLLVTAPALAAGSDAPLAPARMELARRAVLIVKQNCQSCHNPEKHKGGFDLSSREQAIKGGRDGPVIRSADGGESALVRSLAPDADPHMPPKGQLTADEIDVLRRWIDGGLEWPAEAENLPATRPVVLRGLPAAYQPVLALAMAPDGVRLAVGRGDRVLVMEVSANPPKVIADQATPREPVYALAWSPDGRLLAAGGYRNVRLWDLKSAGPERTFDGLAGRVTALAFAPDGGALLAADGEPGAEGIVREWTLGGSRSPVSWTAHRDSIASLDVSPDGTRMATAGADKLVKLWDRAARKEVAVLEGHSSQVMAVAFDAAAARLASAGSDREIKVWDTKTRELVASLTSSPSGVTDLAWLDPKRLLSASEDGVIRLTNLENKQRAERSFSGAPDVVHCLALAPDGKTAYAGCHDGKVYVWAVTGGKLERTIEMPVAGR